MPKETFFNLPAEKQRLILETAVAEFADKPYKAASISRIVRETGIAKGSFYQYFAHKKDLYLYLVHQAIQQKTAFFHSFTPPDPNMGAFPYLRWAFGVRLQFEVAQPQLNKLSYRAIFGDAPFRDEVLRDAEGVADDLTRRVLARGAASGDLDPHLNTELAAFILNSVFMRLAKYLLQELQIDPADLIQEETFLFESPQAAAIFDGVMQILEQGMGN